VLYVHGLFMTGREGGLLGRRLRERGLEGECFAYRSRHETPESVAAKLARRLAASPELNVVGHSLGGVIAALAIARTVAWRGRAVLLGPPLSGSDTARQTARLPGGTWLLGEGGRYLARGVERTAGSRSILVIAGTRNVGIGRLIGACAGPGDGQVRVLETRLAGATHATRRRGHIALLLDRRVARLVADFLSVGGLGDRLNQC
jgi:pimeloyl-ACP methyl ester carboxylesterase